MSVGTVIFVAVFGWFVVWNVRGAVRRRRVLRREGLWNAGLKGWSGDRTGGYGSGVDGWSHGHGHGGGHGHGCSGGGHSGGCAGGGGHGGGH